MPDALDEPKLPSVEDLKKLPLRAIVACATRCAKRVQPLHSWAYSTTPWKWEPDAIERAIALSEGFCLKSEEYATNATRVAAANMARRAAEDATAAARHATTDAAAYADYAGHVVMRSNDA